MKPAPFSYARPATLPEALSLLSEHGDEAKILAGGQSLIPVMNFRLAQPSVVIDVNRVPGLDGLEATADGGLRIGALVRQSRLEREPLVAERSPLLAAAVPWIAHPQIRNRGTIGGNICNASPAGDTLPVLLAVDAMFECASTAGVREVAAHEFWTGYRQTALRDDELLARVRFAVDRSRHTRYRKVGTRAAQAISKVVLALSYRDDDGTWRDVRVALGSVAPTTIRARATEAVLEGARPSETVAAEAARTLAEEVEPIDDVRSTAGYRRSVSGRVLHRLLREEGGW